MAAVSTALSVSAVNSNAKGYPEEAKTSSLVIKVGTAAAFCFSLYQYWSSGCFSCQVPYFALGAGASSVVAYAIKCFKPLPSEARQFFPDYIQLLASLAGMPFADLKIVLQSERVKQLIGPKRPLLARLYEDLSARLSVARFEELRPLLRALNPTVDIVCLHSAFGTLYLIVSVGDVKITGLRLSRKNKFPIVEMQPIEIETLPSSYLLRISREDFLGFRRHVRRLNGEEFPWDLTHLHEERSYQLEYVANHTLHTISLSTDSLDTLDRQALAEMENMSTAQLSAISDLIGSSSAALRFRERLFERVLEENPLNENNWDRRLQFASFYQLARPLERIYIFISNQLFRLIVDNPNHPQLIDYLHVYSSKMPAESFVNMLLDIQNVIVNEATILWLWNWSLAHPLESRDLRYFCCSWARKQTLDNLEAIWSTVAELVPDEIQAAHALPPEQSLPRPLLLQKSL